MARHRHPRARALPLVAALMGCGPIAKEPPPDEWFLGEWFLWNGPCSRACSYQRLVQIEVEPNGAGTIHSESFCFPESREAITWVQDRPDLLVFEPVEPTTNGLQMPDFDFFTLRYRDECRAIGEESANTFELRRGPVMLEPENEIEHGCPGVVVPADETTDIACLDDR